jgi:hypothetical protein
VCRVINRTRRIFVKTFGSLSDPSGRERCRAVSPPSLTGGPHFRVVAAPQPSRVAGAWPVPRRVPTFLGIEMRDVETTRDSLCEKPLTEMRGPELMDREVAPNTCPAGAGYRSHRPRAARTDRCHSSPDCCSQKKDVDPLLSELAGVRPGNHAISWEIGRDGAKSEIRLPVPAVPISQGATPPGRPPGWWAGLRTAGPASATDRGG